MRKDAQAVLLLLIGGTLLKISLAGTYVRYVKPGQLPLLLIAGVALIVVALVTLWQVFTAQKKTPAATVPVGTPAATALGGVHGDATLGGGRDDAVLRVAPIATAPRGAHGDPADHDGDGEASEHEHIHGEPRVGWLLLAPALALLMFAPPALGAFQASRNGTALQAPSNSDFAPLPAGDPVRLSVLDYASRAVFDHGQSLRDRRVTLSGFIIAGPNGQPYLARMIVTCCAADARPVKVGLSGDVPTTLVPDQWVEVVGSYTNRADKDSVNGEVIPYLQVAVTKNIVAPNMQYES